MAGMRTSRRAAHTVYELHYPFVFTTKYRTPVLRGEIAPEVRDLIRQICRGNDSGVLAGHVRPDHVPLLLSVRCPVGGTSVPSHSLRHAVNIAGDPAPVHGRSSRSP